MFCFHTHRVVKNRRCKITTRQAFQKLRKPAVFAFLNFQNVKLQHALCAKVLSFYFCNTQHVLQTCHGANATQGMCSVCCVLAPGSGVRLSAVEGRVSGSISGCRVVLPGLPPAPQKGPLDTLISLLEDNGRNGPPVPNAHYFPFSKTPSREGISRGDYSSHDGGYLFQIG